MPTYIDLCQAENSKAEADKNHVGGVCRVNKNDKFLIKFHNDSYDTPASPPMLGEKALSLSSAPRIPPVKETIRKEMELIHQHNSVREFKYWEGLHAAATNNQTNIDYEAMVLHRERLAYGVDNYEHCRTLAKEKQLERFKNKRSEAAQTMKSSYDAHQQDKLISSHAQEAYEAMQMKSLDYLPDYTRMRVENNTGGHAEENFIRAWESLKENIPEEIKYIELFISRMPCPSESSGFWMGAHMYKEGCMGKLAKLISSESELIIWNITYAQKLNGKDQATAQAMSIFFPEDRVSFSEFGV